MPTKRAKPWDESNYAAPRRSRIRTAWNAVKTVGLLAVIAYVTGWFVGRTEGFRSIVESRLTRALGLPVKLDRVSVDWRYNLTLYGLRTEGGRRPGYAPVTARRVEIEWMWSDLFRRFAVGINRIELERPTIAFERDDNGRWSPHRLAPYGRALARQFQIAWEEGESAEAGASSRSGEVPAADKEGAEALAEAVRSAGLDASIRVVGGELSWWLDTQAPRASLEGVTLEITPLRAPGRAMRHVWAKVKRASSLDGPAFRDLTLELLDIGDQQIVLRFTADHHPNTR
ncbi:MAG: hypothetical protein NZ740_07305 [Kiritimatiellae bacterium]|nr:hypothetical protein [Kiritimatiellia bacterium]MDW8458905.1 hypothetical protein [Verrucomicrobiota bacterium]